MGAQLCFGTAGATGGGFSAQPGTLQPALVERWAFPKWQWQARAPLTWKDRNCWYSLWSFGCRIGYGAPTGSDGVSVNRDLSTPDLFEPFSCDGEGTQSMNFLRGTCKDESDTPVANAIVQAFVTATDAFAGEVQANTDGTYVLGVQQSKATAHYLVAYKAGAPDIAGTTVNTLVPTNVDGS
jgi:hypothetical protein